MDVLLANGAGGRIWGVGVGTVVKPAYYNEIDPYCCRVLRKQIAAGNLPAGDVDERDIRDVRTSDLAGYGAVHLFAGIGGIPLGLRMGGMADDFPIITGGFPCQDISNAGKRAGIDGARSGLWSEYARIVRDVRPAYVLVENVAALLGRGISRVLGDLAEIGYDAEWHCIPAAAVGAPHIRDRVFILAYSQCDPLQRDREPGQLAGAQNSYQSTEEERQRVWYATGDSGQALADANSPEWRTIPKGRDVLDRNDPRWEEAPGGLSAFRQDAGWRQWAIEPAICRVVDGVPHRVDRLRGLGNAVVPQVVQLIAEQIMAAAALGTREEW